jgi:hypothetical protein
MWRVCELLGSWYRTIIGGTNAEGGCAQELCSETPIVRHGVDVLASTVGVFTPSQNGYQLRLWEDVRTEGYVKLKYLESIRNDMMGQKSGRNLVLRRRGV